MSSQRLHEFRNKEDKELRYEQGELERELFDLRFKSSAEGLGNPHRIRELRRDIARIKTLLRERELGVRGARPRT